MELSHRAEELTSLGWSNDDVARYIELWDYRQRWGAINLEREDRQFLRKAEAAMPKVVVGKSSIKKPLNEKSYYKRIVFNLESMNKLEKTFKLSSGSKGIWRIVLEEELRALDYYQPVLGLPDTIKAKALEPFREEIIQKALKQYDDIQVKKYDFNASLRELVKKEATKWRPLRDLTEENSDYPILSEKAVKSFRSELRSEFLPLIKSLFPSLAESDKTEPADDWNPS